MGRGLKNSIASLLLAICVSSSSCNVGVNPNGTREVNLKPTDSSVDFGIEREGAVVEFPLVLDNTTAAPLKIANVSASCGCTVPDAEYPTTIQPGELVSIPIKWTLPAGSGSRSSSIVVSFEDQAEPGRQYALKAEVPETHPTEFALGIVGPPPVREQYDFLLEPFPGESGFSVIKAEGSSNSISVSAISSEQAGFRLAFQYATDAPHEINESITIETNDPIQPLRTVRITGRVIDFVEIQEKVLYLGSASPNEPRSVGIKLLSPAREQKDQLSLLDSNFQALAAKGLDVTLDNSEDLTLLVTTTPEIDVNRSKGVLQREIATFNWSFGEHRGKTTLEILFLVI